MLEDATNRGNIADIKKHILDTVLPFPEVYRDKGIPQYF